MAAKIQVEHPVGVTHGEAFTAMVQSDSGLDDLFIIWRGSKVPLSNQQENSAEVLLAVPLDTKEKSFNLQVVNAKSQMHTLYSTSIKVFAKDYPLQELTVNPKYVTPDPSLKPRLKDELRRTRAVLNMITPVKHWNLPLVQSVPGGMTSEFGFRRVFNGKPRNPHKGVDQRGAIGTPIKSIAAGTVALVEDFYYSGKHVIVDHGLGVLSLYAHMSEQNVKVGDFVEAGDVLGLVGETGRVTGPHLHLGLYVLGVSTNVQPLTPGLITAPPLPPDEKVSKKNATSKSTKKKINTKQAKNKKKAVKKNVKKSAKKAAKKLLQDRKANEGRVNVCQKSS